MTNTKKQGGKTYHRKTIKNSGKKGGKMFQSFKKGMNEFFHGLDDDKQKNLIYNLFLLSMKPMDGQVVASMDFNELSGSAGKIFTTFGIDENIGKAGVNKSATSNDSSLSEKDETVDFFKECSEYQTDKWRHGPTSDKSKKDLEEKRAAMKKKENPVEKQEEKQEEKPVEKQEEKPVEEAAKPDESKAEEPKQEEPKADEPKQEEPKAEEPKQEEPK